APERPYLRVAKGKDLGKEFFLGPGETGVGRSIDNDVILTDIAVSRRHLKVHMSDAGLLKIIDLGSGNGSTVNGQRVREAPLNQGDRIELGETTLVVEIPGAAQ
ncbi:MAG: FHA domain-containing protein, partial [Gammaproteobacteria bacterium]|nr:FHA domain-containing protein [Gemmatimonadota bacterium]NIU78357.1 FHA domain-containing protein [Gammaproteobacteria bacterium]